ncbi:ABC transporter ATP-binding protein [Actinopolymorpha sp. B17G11]|uniref:ABC transporter ATP-binding protein n=1 Tax=Actinopolymorpha sp. B17G11 TaxID=3160861 RepID=UPI0032E518F8
MQVAVPASAIEVSDLTKRYGDVLAVDHLTLRVQPGEIYALLGLNGAGKTTTIRMLLGMVRPSSGSVSVLAEQVRPEQSSVWSRVGYLVETPAAYPELTVRENLEIVRRLRGLTDPWVVDDVLAQLGLVPYAGRRARTLSLGNSQRLGLAKALIHRPDLLILDEPANGLDPAGVAEVRDLLHDLAHRHGVAILLSSHILTEVARLATRIGIIHHGRMVEEIAAADLTAHTRPRLTVVTRNAAGAMAALRAAGHFAELDGHGKLVLTDERALHHADEVATLLVNADCPPTRLAVEQDDLETYFLQLVGAIPAAGDG